MRHKKYAHDVGSHPERLKAAIIGLVIIVVGAGFFWWNNRTGGQNDPVPALSSDHQEESTHPEFVSVNGRYLFSGTVVPARAVENEARRSDGSVDYAQPFSKFDTFNPSQYDGWMVDFECPMTVNDIPYQTQVSNTVFNCPDEFAPELAKYFTVANVANNHTRDQGDDGYEETVQHLEAAGIQTVGHWDPRETDDICEVIALKVRLQKADKSEEQGTLPVAFCAWHYFEKDPSPGELAEMDKYAEIMPVFAFSQVGVEYRPNADPKQIAIAHELIDEHDPEFVIENSPHWVQETEAYKGKLIAYSTGNFIFDQLDPETNRGLSIDAEMSIAYDDNVAAWLKLGESCKPRGDDCLEKAKQQGLKKIDLSLKYEAVGSSTGYRELTQKAKPDLQAAIEQRANWKQTLTGLEN